MKIESATARVRVADSRCEFVVWLQGDGGLLTWDVNVNVDKNLKKKIGGKMSQRMMIDWEAAYVPVKLRIRLAFIMRTVRY